MTSIRLHDDGLVYIDGFDFFTWTDDGGKPNVRRFLLDVLQGEGLRFESDILLAFAFRDRNVFVQEEEIRAVNAEVQCVAIVGGCVATDGNDEFPFLFGVVVLDRNGIRLGGPFPMGAGHAEGLPLRGGGIIDHFDSTAFAMKIEADDREDVPRVHCLAFANLWNIG